MSLSKVRVLLLTDLNTKGAHLSNLPILTSNLLRDMDLDVTVDLVTCDLDLWKRRLNQFALEGVERVVVMPLTCPLTDNAEAISKKLGMDKRDGWVDLAVGAGKLKLYYASDPLTGSMLMPLLIAGRTFQILSQSEVTKELQREGSQLPESIYDESFDRIRSLIADSLKGKTVLEAELILRAVHATADIEVARLINFNGDAASVGVEAISRGAGILVDTLMVKAGLYDAGLKRFGCRIKCYLYDERTLRLAESAKMTKTAAAVRVAAEDGVAGDVIAFGNAPTAVLELIKLTGEGKVYPSLIIATPCGFVNAERSKELVAKLKIPSITIRGVKGGSAVAASLVNCLATQARRKG